MSDEKVTQKVIQTQVQQQEQQQQDQQQTVDMKTYLELIAKMEKMEQMLSQEAEKQKEIAAKQQELFQKQVQLTLKENGLEKFADFADILKVSNEDELNDVVKKLSQIVNEIKVETGYIPADHAKTDEYSKYEKEKNAAGMIAVKLSKLFQ